MCGIGMVVNDARSRRIEREDVRGGDAGWRAVRAAGGAGAGRAKHGVKAFNIFDYDDPADYPANFWLPEADHFKTLSDSDDDEYGAGYKRYAVGYTPMRATRRGPARRRAAARSARGARANKYKWGGYRP
eukprot:jgi/Mesvir1/16573/Mv10109-RA.1